MFIFQSPLDFSTLFCWRRNATPLITCILVSCIFFSSSSSHFSLSLSLFQIIKHLRTAEFKPFIVFVKPPSIETLRETRQNGKVVAGKDDNKLAKPFTVRESLFSVFSNNMMSQMSQMALP